MASTASKLETLQKAGHSLDFAVSDLRNALKHSNAVETIVILGLIERAATLANDAKALSAAVNETANEAET